MLVLKRRIGEQIVIDGDIRVRVLGVHGKSVRVGIEAPVEISIRRSELDCQAVAGQTVRTSSLCSLADVLPELPGKDTPAADWLATASIE